MTLTFTNREEEGHYAFVLLVNDPDKPGLRAVGITRENARALAVNLIEELSV